MDPAASASSTGLRQRGNAGKKDGEDAPPTSSSDPPSYSSSDPAPAKGQDAAAGGGGSGGEGRCCGAVLKFLCVVIVLLCLGAGGAVGATYAGVAPPKLAALLKPYGIVPKGKVRDPPPVHSRPCALASYLNGLRRSILHLLSCSLGFVPSRIS